MARIVRVLRLIEPTYALSTINAEKKPAYVREMPTYLTAMTCKLITIMSVTITSVSGYINSTALRPIC